MEVREVVIQEVTKASPPVTVGALSLIGLPLQDWIIIVTIVYTVLQIFFLIRDKWWRDRKRGKYDQE